MDKLSSSFLPKFLISSLIGLHIFAPVSVHALTVSYNANVKSKCVTADTKKLHASTLATMNKDIAPHKGNKKAEAAIAAYQESILMAWEAMEQPYCGHGSPGASSARKSYVKTATRVRAAFVAQAKSFKSSPATTSLAAPVTTTQPAMKPTTAPATSTPPVKPAATTTKEVVAKPTVAVAAKPVAARTPIPRGLRRGMRSSSIAELQRRLLTHFGEDTSNITTYFGPLTQNLLIRFQLEKKVIATRQSPGAGQVGPLTAAALNAM